MPSKTQSLALLFLLSIVLAPAFLLGQQQLPDAPKPQNPISPNAPVGGPNPTARPSGSQPAGSPEDPAPEPADAGNTPPKMPPVSGTPRESKQRGGQDSREELFVLRRNVTFVSVPVTVKDLEGRLVTGLVAPEFSVFEDGIKQNITFFTSDPFPLSAAIVVSTGMSNQDLKKVQASLPALIGSFSQFDEVALFTYGSTVRRVSDFAIANGQVVTEALRRVQKGRGRNPGSPVVGGPMGSGPQINSRPIDPGGPMVPSVEQESHVLNDAVLAAATELARRDNAEHWQVQQIRPRKIIFVISDGRDEGSRAAYGDVLKLLLTNDITVYAVGVGSAAIPGIRDAGRFRIPGFGQGNILPKYASATGGQVFPEISVEAIENAYSTVTSEARNQYTIGYLSRSTPSSAYRTIEVRVRRPGLKIYARDGYYLAPPLKQGSTQQ